MLSKLWFFYKQSILLSFKPKLSFKNNCSFSNTFNYQDNIDQPILGSCKCSISMSLLKKYSDNWYSVLAHEVGHTLDKERMLNHPDKIKDKEYLFESELKAWVIARNLLLYNWHGKYDWDNFKASVTYGLGSYLVYCYEPQDRADVWCRVEKELGIRDTY